MAQLLSRDPETVVVTGASGGVGRATARAFDARGDRVAPPARGREGLGAALTVGTGLVAARRPSRPVRS